MIVNHVHHALRQVRELRQNIIEKQRFKGYSGRARALGGAVALGAGFLMSGWSLGPGGIVWGWIGAAIVAGLLNYGALVYWFLTDPDVGRDMRRLKPALEVLPVFAAGVALTTGMAVTGQFEMIYALWMCLYGLAQFNSRHVLPSTIRWVGWYYVGAGICLGFWPGGVPMETTLLMGGVFFLGEFFGGLTFHFDEHPERSLAAFFGFDRRPDRRTNYDTEY